MLQNTIASLPDQLQLPFPADSYLPPCTDRSYWDNISPVKGDKIRKDGEAALIEDYPALPASLYSEFYRNGNRVNFENVYFRRRALLLRLVKAYCLEPGEVLLEKIMDGLVLICDEWTWILPAHNRPYEDPLPPVETTELDLFAGTTSSLLAMTIHLLRTPLNGKSTRLVARVEKECRDRCLKPYLENDNHVWMGFSEDPSKRALNNWTPWITDNFLHSLFLIEKEESKLKAGVKRAGIILNIYLDVLPADGGCDEGPTYWDHAVASLFDCLEILHWGCGKTTPLLEDPYLKKAASFIASVHITRDYFVNYADSVGRLDHLPVELMYRMGSVLDDSRLCDLAAELNKTTPGTEGGQEEAFSTQRQIRNMPVDLKAHQPSAQQAPPTEHYGELQISLIRNKFGTFSCKGGHNDESHNHNDVGQFILYGKKAPLLIDPGVGDYTKETFNEKRYTIWTMQTGWHNLPQINGCDQNPGKEFRSSLFEFDGENRCRVGMEKAYPKEACVNKWLRTYTCSEDRVILEDAWELKGKDGRIIWNFISLDEPQFTPEGFTLRNPAGETLACLYDRDALSGDREYKPFPPDDGKMNEWKREGLWRTRLSLKADAPRKGEQIFIITVKK